MKNIINFINGSLFLGIILIIAGIFEIKSRSLGMYGDVIATGDIAIYVGLFVVAIGIGFVIVGIKIGLKRIKKDS